MHQSGFEDRQALTKFRFRMQGIRETTAINLRLVFLVLFALTLAAACGPTPTPPGTPATPNPNFTATPGPSPTPGPPTLTPTASPSPTPTPIELIVCQTGEPLSLYLYGDDTRARSAIMQALFDGPIDTVGYVDQPVILAALPSVEAGTAGVLEVDVSPGQSVVKRLQ